jgi:hypothetical protein
MYSKEQVRSWWVPSRFSRSLFFCLLALLFLCSGNLQAKPMGPTDAEKLVRGWLKYNSAPLGAQVGAHIKETEVYTDAIGEAMYYVVYLQPEGFVIVPADGQVEPIIALVAHGTYAPSPDNPLGALVSRDVPGRIAAVRALRARQKEHPQNNDLAKRQAALQEAASRAERKWAKLQSYDEMVTTTGIPMVSDVRVAPLVQTKWAQTGLWLFSGGEPEYFPMYDYYTPGPYYPCGCVATAMAQLMRYHEHPTGDVGTPSYTIYVDGSPLTASLRGGDGTGGAYHWNDMVFDPNVYTPEEQRQAIGALCYDAGVAVEMSYYSGGSSAGAFKISGALTGPFDYNKAIYGDLRMDLGLDELMEMMNPNLDANLPVLLTVWGRATTGAFHEVVCDGYGYDNSTLYHHLNMGWRGNDNTWYALPEVGTEYEFNSITDCTYNIFKSDSGEIISGRVTDAGGVPVDQATVIAHAYGGQTYLATTNEKGIYALHVPSNTLFFAQAVRNGWHFNPCEVRTGTSVDDSWASGNLWGLNFSGTGSAGFVDLERQAYITGEVVTVRVVDADLQGIGTETITLMVCSGDTETITLTESPVDSGIFAADVPTVEGTVTTEDGVIQAAGTQTLIAVYQDSNDGSGNPITRRDVATVATAQTTIYETDFTGGLPAGWTIINGFDDENTWNSENPGGQYSPYWSGTFMIVDCQHPFAMGFDEELITHSIDCSMYERVTLIFNHHFYHGGSETASVDVRADGGDWQNVARYQVASAYGLEEIDISPVAAGRANVQVRWHYYEEGVGDYWGIDDVKVSGVVPLVGIPGDFEPDCDVDWADAAVLADEWLTDGGQADIFPADGGDGTVNMFDLAVIGQTWMVGVH